MKCPKCGQENYNGSNFCIACGTRLFYTAPASAPAPVQKPDSALKKAVIAILKAAAYFAVYYAIENLVVLVYEIFMMGQMGITSFMNGGYSGLSDMYDDLYSRLAENMSLLMILAAALTVLTYCIIFSVRQKKPLEEMHIRPAPLKEAGLAILWGIALNPVVSVLISFLPIPESLIESYTEGYDLLYGGPLLTEIIFVVIFTPILEEIVFRGLIFTRLRKGMPETLAFILTCIIFGVVHGHIISFAYAGILCIAMLALFRKHDSIVLSAAFHLGFNGSSYLIDLLPDNLLLVYAIFFVCIAAAIAFGFLLFCKNRYADEETAEEPVQTEE